MNEYISRDDVRRMILEYSADNPQKQTVWAMVISDMLRDLKEIPATDVQPLSVVAEHIKKRLYQTAFNTTEEKARNAIVDMAERIDFWIDELKDGDTE